MNVTCLCSLTVLGAVVRAIAVPSGSIIIALVLSADTSVSKATVTCATMLPEGYRGDVHKDSNISEKVAKETSFEAAAAPAAGVEGSRVVSAASVASFN